MASLSLLFSPLFANLLIGWGTYSIVSLEMNSTNSEVLLTCEIELKLSAFSMEVYHICIKPKIFGKHAAITEGNFIKATE
jgi:hypothetical protein